MGLGGPAVVFQDPQLWVLPTLSVFFLVKEQSRGLRIRLWPFECERERDI
jgi:hypothetical protein